MPPIRRLTFPALTTLLLCCVSPSTSNADEVFVKIHQVDGNRIAITWQSQGSEIRGVQASPNTDPQAVSGRGSARRGRGRFGTQAEAMVQQTVIEIPPDAMITSAMRERRTFEFRVGAELAGGLQNPVFLEMQQPLEARIVTDGERIMELNVITGVSDTNQSVTDAGGQTVIAIRPKRPPMKKRR